ncbi:hypothetical protein [Desulfocurvus sp. DL9XJH121]
MRKDRTKTILLLAVVAMLLAGCSHKAMVTSFQDITSESKRQGWFYGRQYSSVSIPGFNAAYEPGRLYSYNPARGPLTATGIAPGEQSLIISKTVQGSDDENAIIAIKTQLETVKQLTEEVVQARIDMLKNDINAKAGSGTTIFNNVDANAATAYSTKLGQLKAAETTLNNQVNKNGIMIFRWAYGTVADESTDVAEILKTNNEAGAQSSGYAIINGLRVSTLYVGTDILKQWNEVRDIGFWRAWPQIVTTVAQTRQIAYTSELDLEQVFAAELNLDYETVENVAANWKTELSVVIKTYAARFEKCANTGLIGKEVITQREVDWGQRQTTQETALPAHLQEWSTFYQTSTSLKALKKTMGGDHPYKDG